MSDKWDDKLTEKFLTLYRKHKCLWNPYSFNYRNCSDKNEAFKSVIHELNRPRIGLAQCLQQIEVIRANYKEEQLKVERNLKSGKSYHSKLPWFNLMSQMLSEVITDEENFSKNPVGFRPCSVEKIISKNKPNEDYEAFFLPEKYPNSSLRTPLDVSRNDNNADNLWNKCPSCGWGKNKNQESGSNNSNRIEIEDVAKGRKKVQLNAVYGGNHSCNQSDVEKLSNIELSSTEDRSNCSCQHDVESQNTFMYIQNQQQENNKNQSLEKRATNVEIDQNNCYIDGPKSNVDSYRNTVNRKSQRILEFEDNESDEHDNADKYEFSSQFKIIIPSSDGADGNLEITGYGIRVMTQQLSDYFLYPSGAVPKIADNQNCECERQLCLSKKSENVDPVRYTSIIKLRVNRKLKRSSNEFHDKKRSHTKGTKYKKHKSETGKKDSASEIEVQHESLPNKRTQTDACCENRTIQTLYEPETSNPSDHTCVKGCTVDQNSPGDRTHVDFTSCGTNYLNEAVPFTEHFGNSSINESGSSEKSQGENTAASHMIENIPSASVQEKFNNTRTFLNVIVKILEADDTAESAVDLQTTLNSMLDRFERISDYTAGEERNADISGRAMINDHSRSTQDQSFIPRNRHVDADDLRVASPVLTSDHFFELPTDETSMFALPGEVQNNVANGTAVNSGIMVEKSEVNGNEEVNKNNSPAPELLDNTKTTSVASINTTNEFENEEPVASSSRKFEERPTSSQLTKDFLDILKYTMMMDDTLNSTDYTGNNQCCQKSNKFASPRRSKD